jgi:hypothetical protein
VRYGAGVVALGGVRKITGRFAVNRTSRHLKSMELINRPLSPDHHSSLVVAGVQKER